MQSNNFEFKDVLGNEIKVYFDPGPDIKITGPVAFIIARDGIYKVRTNDLGQFISKVQEISGLKDAELPETKLTLNEKIPISFLRQTYSFFADVTAARGTESMLRIYKVSGEYVIAAPQQVVSGASVHYREDTEDPIIMDLHSHAGMHISFSGVDDGDEKAYRLYAVMKNLLFSADIDICVMNMGNRYHVSVEDVFEPDQNGYNYRLTVPYPQEWKTKLVRELPTLPTAQGTLIESQPLSKNAEKLLTKLNALEMISGVQLSDNFAALLSDLSDDKSRLTVRYLINILKKLDFKACEELRDKNIL